jgi:hypothetical protein
VTHWKPVFLDLVDAIAARVVAQDGDEAA